MFAACNSHRLKSVHHRKLWHCTYFFGECWDENERAAEYSAASVVSCISAAPRERLKMLQHRLARPVTILEQCRQEGNEELFIYFLAVFSKNFLWVGSLHWNSLNYDTVSREKHGQNGENWPQSRQRCWEGWFDPNQLQFTLAFLKFGWRCTTSKAEWWVVPLQLYWMSAMSSDTPV